MDNVLIRCLVRLHDSHLPRGPLRRLYFDLKSAYVDAFGHEAANWLYRR